MLRCSILLLVIFFSRLPAYAQQEKMVIRFADGGKMTALPNVALIDRSGTTLATTDSAGALVLPFSALSASGYLLAVCPGYRPDTIRGSETMVYLQPLAVQLTEAVVNGSKVERLLKSNIEYVVDYGFAGDKIIVASYSGNNGKNAKLFLLDNSGTVVNNCDLPHEPLSLFKSCVGNYYCESRDMFYPLAIHDKDVTLKPPYKVNLLPGLQQCECAIDGNLYYKIGDRNNFRMTYGMIKKGDSVFRPIKQFEESKVAQASFSEYMTILALLENYQFNEAARIQRLRSAWDKGTYNHMNLALQTTNDTLIIFDYFGKQLRFYDKDGNKLENVQLQFRWTDAQRLDIIKDEMQNRFYIHRYDNQGRQSLEELNVHTGTATDRVFIEKPMAERVRVNNGAAYYLWQRSGGGQTRQLFRQQL